MEKSCRKFTPNASPRPLFNFGKIPKTAIACKKFFLRLSKSTKNINFMFSFEPVSCNGQDYEKQKRPETSD